MSKKYIYTNLIVEKSSQINCEDFKRMHECLESYIKEILLLGLRNKGGKYKESDRVIRHSFIKVKADTFDKAMLLIGMPSWRSLKANNTKLRKLENLVLNYSCHVRNILVHGGYYPSKPNEYELLYNIDKNFIIEIEQEIFKKFGKNILQNKPKDFGIIRGTTDNESFLFSLLGTCRLEYPDFSQMQTSYKSIFP